MHWSLAHIVQAVPSGIGQVSSQLYCPLLYDGADEKRTPPQELSVYGPTVIISGKPKRGG